MIAAIEACDCLVGRIVLLLLLLVWMLLDSRDCTSLLLASKPLAMSKRCFRPAAVKGWSLGTPFQRCSVNPNLESKNLFDSRTVAARQL